MIRYQIVTRMLSLLVILVSLQACSTEFDPWYEDPVTGRWFTQAQVVAGEQLYQTHCLNCHGPRAAATPQWIKPAADGRYPPPPLNGTAHAWHHPLAQLRKTINEGTPGGMPGWKNKLTEREVDALIAWFQSLWPDRGYQLWQQRHKR